MQLGLNFSLPFRQTPSGNPDLSYNHLQKKIRAYLPRRKVGLVHDVYRFAAEAHQGQKRYSGEPYITHPVTVASMVADMQLDEEAISAALLHDTIEDTPVTLGNIQQEFGVNIANLVEGLTKLRAIRKKFVGGAGLTSAQAANFQKLALAMSNDLRVIFIKFSDRFHNLKTAKALRPERRRLMAKETMLIYAPLANRLGMEKLRMELEDLSFAAAYPIRYYLIERAVSSARAHRQKYMEEIIISIRQLLKEGKLRGRIVGRRKNLAGIYNKMVLRKSEWMESHPDKEREPVSLHEIMDVYGVRIITDTTDSCYRILGCLHSWRKPVPGRFKDYVANPKKNGYQSLHTTLIGPNGYPLEVQIRTEEMNVVAETGIAAHFLYKANGNKDNSPWLSKWLQGITQLRKETATAGEFVERFKMDLNSDEVYVYTPEGEVINLPEGATPIDFAYALHTDLGARCVACEIDHRPASLNTRLETGQIVRIITHPQAYPDISWNTFAVTPKALSHITHHANMQKNRDARAMGKKLLINALSHYNNLSLKDISEERWKEYLGLHKLYNKAQLYEQLTAGKMTPLVAAAFLVEENPASTGSSLAINRQDSIIKYSACCHPIPGDEIVAVPTKHGSINIHRIGCHNIVQERKKDKAKYVAAHWDQGMQKGQFLALIRCETHNLPDVLSRIVNILDNQGVRIESILTHDKAVNLRVLSISLWVEDRGHLARIIRRLRLVRDITSISRARG